jgi:hypothetical protein
MRAKITLALGSAALMGVGLALVACGSDSNSKDGGSDATVDDTGVIDDTGVMMDTGPKDSGVVPTGCAALDGGTACRQCCVMENPDGALFFQGAIHACVCGGMFCNNCASTYCNMPPQPPSQNCTNCALATLSADGGQCFGPVGNACANNKDCVGWFQCNAKCK